MEQQSKPLLIAVGGMSGSGKTSLAKALQESIPNAVHLDSDQVRKEIFGVSETTRLPPEAYSAEATQHLIDEMVRRAKENITAGKNVIISAIFLDPKSRAFEEKLAQDAGAQFKGIWLQADLGVLFDRVSRRVGDASDAKEDIVKMQAAHDPGTITWTVINADQTRGDVLKDALKVVMPVQKTQPVIKPPAV